MEEYVNAKRFPISLLSYAPGYRRGCPKLIGEDFRVESLGHPT
jgi:hypothetical protein